MSRRVIVVCIVLFGLATLGFAGSAYWQAYEARKDAISALQLVGDATQFAERARREARVAIVVLPGLQKRIVLLEERTTALRETLFEVPGITVRAVRPLKDAISELGVAVADIRDKVRSAEHEARRATTAARAAHAQSSAAYNVASEAHDVAIIAYNAEAVSALGKLFEEFEIQQQNFATLTEDMQRIRDFGRDRRVLSMDYDALFYQSLKLQCAMLQSAMAYNALAENLGADFMKQHGLPLEIK